ncbi:MAG: hypothetical protein FJY88_04670 [Candidatus Eisenbacteria bacterium]|nr:hypothetical protein [Candidatus Eisenbacteria bacterium]
MIPSAVDGFQVEDFDFRYASANLNAVFRWEYRPGSTLFLVWTHGRESYSERRFGSDPERFDNSVSTDALFRNEPENRFLAKITYWFPI